MHQPARRERQNYTRLKMALTRLAQPLSLPLRYPFPVVSRPSAAFFSLVHFSRFFVSTVSLSRHPIEISNRCMTGLLLADSFLLSYLAVTPNSAWSRPLAALSAQTAAPSLPLACVPPSKPPRVTIFFCRLLIVFLSRRDTHPRGPILWLRLPPTSDCPVPPFPRGLLTLDRAPFSVPPAEPMSFVGDRGTYRFRRHYMLRLTSFL